MRSRTMATAMAAVALVFAGGAAAQARGTWVSFAPEQTAVSGGGGVADFVGPTMRANTRVGADWDARLTFGTRSPFAFEAGYTGMYNALASTSGGVAPYLVQSSLDAAVRINLLPWRVEPFIFGGVGYNHVDVVNRDQDPAMAAKLRESDDQLMVPTGAGVAAYLTRHTAVDARFTYRSIFHDNLLIDNPGARQDSYTVAARVGYTF